MRQMLCFLTVWSLTWWVTPVPAATKSLQITVASGKEDRTNVPVRHAITLPAALAEAKSVVLKDADGRSLAGQLTAPGLLAKSASTSGGTAQRELHFILPSLKAGKPVTLQATIATEAPAKVEGFVWQDTSGETTELRFGNRSVLRYVYKALDDSSKENRELTYKVYHHLYDPSGKRLVTKGPGGLYPHHRGLYYGFNRISYGNGKKADTWHCTGDAHQSHQGFLATEAGPVLGRHRVAIHWHGPKKEVFAKEEREMTVYHVPGGVLVEFASRLRSTVGKVQLDGDPQHAGFQFRADNEVADQVKQKQKLTYYLRPDGAGQPGETRNWPGDKGHVNLPWNAMSFVLGGKRYTAAYLDHPSNPKEARYSERDYGRFGSYFVFELDETKALEINYRLWLQEGEMTVPDVAAGTASFIQPLQVTVK